MKEETALTTVTPGGALEIPDWLKNDQEAQALNTQFDQSEIRLPQLKLCQSMTPQRKRTDPNYIEKLAEGDFFNDASGQIYGTGPLRFVIMKYWVNYIVFKPVEQGGGIECRGILGNDGVVRDEEGKPLRTTFGPKGEKPEVTKFMNYLFYLTNTNEIVWFSAKSTFLKVMKGFNSSLRGISGVADFAKLFTLSSASKPGAAPGQEYFIPVIPRLPVGIITDQALYGKLKKYAIDLKDKTIDTSAAEVADEEDGDTVDGEKVPF
jgi:hypothetical protein